MSCVFNMADRHIEKEYEELLKKVKTKLTPKSSMQIRFENSFQTHLSLFKHNVSKVQRLLEIQFEERMSEKLMYRVQ